jgi:hypothetical protein
MGGNPVQDGRVAEDRFQLSREEKTIKKRRVRRGIEVLMVILSAFTLNGRRFHTASLFSAAPGRSGYVLHCNYDAMGLLINFLLRMYYRLGNEQTETILTILISGNYLTRLLGEYNEPSSRSERLESESYW